MGARRSARVSLHALRRRARYGDRRRRPAGRVDRDRGRGRDGGGASMHRIRVRVAEGALDANDTIAAANRADFERHAVTVVNLMSAPGAGKTMLLEASLPGLEGVRPGVLEGDVAGSLDADRLAAV